METKAYSVPKTIKESSERWKYGHDVTDCHLALKEAVSEALDNKLFYNRDVDDFCAEYLGVTDFDRDIDKRSAEGRRVEGGPFGYDVYLCRKEVEAERFAQADKLVRNELALSVGKKIGKLKPNDFKLTRGCVVEEMSDSDVTIIGSRGPQKVRIKCSYTALKCYIERAAQ